MRFVSEPTPGLVADIAIQPGPQAPSPLAVTGEIFLLEEAATKALEELEKRAVDLAFEVSTLLGRLEALSRDAGSALTASISRWTEAIDAFAARDDIVSQTAEMVRGECFGAIRNLSHHSSLNETTNTDLLQLAHFDLQRALLRQTLEEWDLLDEDVQIYFALKASVRLKSAEADAL